MLPALPAVLRRLAPLYARLRPSRDPAQDAARLGPLATLVIHATLAAAERPSRVAAVRARPLPALPGDGPVILVQAESFMDPARLHPALAGAMPHWAALRAQAVRHGALDVPCWGANTVRSEFAVLTGVAEPMLGLDRFNPYEAFARGGLPSIAWAARAAGYRTAVVHPFDPGFYGRKHGSCRGSASTVSWGRRRSALRRPGTTRGMPRWRRCRRAGAGDGAAGVRVRHHDGLARPLGRRPRALPPELAGVAEAGPLAGWLQAMRGTDAMLPALADALRTAGSGWLAVYGDHQPSLPGALAALGVSDRRTDYLVWGVGQPPGSAQDGSADALGRILVEAMPKA